MEAEAKVADAKKEAKAKADAVEKAKADVKAFADAKTKAEEGAAKKAALCRENCSLKQRVDLALTLKQVRHAEKMEAKAKANAEKKEAQAKASAFELEELLVARHNKIFSSSANR